MNTDFAYLAGVVDSDGCIRVERLNNHGRSADSVSFGAIVTIQQVESQAVELAKRVFGGHILHIKPKNESSRPMYRWTIKSQGAASALRLLLPFLRIKKMQAENAIQLSDILTTSRSERMRGREWRSGAARRSEAATAAMQKCYERSRALNSGDLNPAYAPLQNERLVQPGLELG